MKIVIFRYYGLMMWFPELFSRFDEFSKIHNGAEAGVCEVTDYVVNMGSHSEGILCNDKISSSVFMESLITVSAALPSNIIAVLGMDRLGRKFFLGKYNYLLKLYFYYRRFIIRF